jgi:hypothetical protein
MQNVVPSGALVRRSRQLLLVAFIVVSVGIFLAVVGLAMIVFPLAPLANQTVPAIARLVFVLGVIAGLVGLGLAVRAVTWRTENDLAKITGNYLSQHLDQRFTFIRNVSRLGLGYIDAVLVGPPGALVFRIVGDTGTFFNEAGNWLRSDKQGNWVPLRYNPTKQAVDDIQHLREYLAKKGIPDVPVFGVVVLTQDPPATQLSVENPVVPAAQLQGVMDILQNNYFAKDRVDVPTSAAIIKTLYNP